MSKGQLYSDYLRREGFLPEIEANGDVRFKYQGETYLVSAAEDDPSFFKISYLHIWDSTRTASAWPILNALNGHFKALKVFVSEDVICLTTETFLKSPEDFEAIFPRCLEIVNLGKQNLAAALTQQASGAPVTGVAPSDPATTGSE